MVVNQLALIMKVIRIHLWTPYGKDFRAINLINVYEQQSGLKT